MAINGTVITENRASGDASDQGGAGVFNAGGSIEVDGALISNNVADGDAGSGGGILNDKGTLIVLNTEISGNSCFRAGGGIEENSESGQLLILEKVILDGNSTAGAPGNGGGLHITGSGNSEIRFTLVTNNSASSTGAGLWNGSGLMLVTQSTISGNICTGSNSNQGGGGLYNLSGRLDLSNSAVVRNECTGDMASGAGIFNDNTATANISYTTISGNNCNNMGGGIYNTGESLSINASTIAMNQSSVAGGGVFAQNETILKSSIVANNSAASGSDVSGSFTSQSYNLIGTDDSDDFDEDMNDIEGSDPKLEMLDDNGGMTMTHKLQSGSPCYNTGDPDNNSMDQIGQDVFDGRRDIGSYESQEVLITSSLEEDLNSVVVSFHPNPAASNLFIETSTGDIIDRVQFRNSLGQLIMDVSIKETQDRIDLSSLSKGQYHISFFVGNKIISRNLIKL